MRKQRSLLTWGALTIVTLVACTACTDEKTPNAAPASKTPVEASPSKDPLSEPTSSTTDPQLTKWLEEFNKELEFVEDLDTAGSWTTSPKDLEKSRMRNVSNVAVSKGKVFLFRSACKGTAGSVDFNVFADDVEVAAKTVSCQDPDGQLLREKPIRFVLKNDITQMAVEIQGQPDTYGAMMYALSTPSTQK